MLVSFKQGTRSSFDSLTSYTAGAFYVTTDEGSVYLATSASNVKRLGNFVEVSSVGDLPTGGPNRVEGLYFVKAANALYRWDVTSSAWTKIASDGGSFESIIVSELPTTGDPSKMYLLQTTRTGEDQYDKYIWVASLSRFEKFNSASMTWGTFGS